MGLVSSMVEQMAHRDLISRRNNVGNLVQTEMEMEKLCADRAETNCKTAGTEVQIAVSSLTNEWLDTNQAAAYLKVSVGALRNMTSNGQISYYKLGNRNRYRMSELQSLLLSQKRGAIYGN